MSSEDEYTEEDLDALLENDSYMDQSSMNMIDLDLLLARPSESQRRAEDELNKRDLIIRNQEEVSELAEKEVKDEIAAMEKKHAEVPRQIGLYPPGLVYFSGEGFSVLIEAGLPVTLVDKILSDRMTLVRNLTPEIPGNNLIATSEDYVAICDFLFFSLTVCPSRVVRNVLEKALFDLFKTYGYIWKLTNSHLFACWINFGANESQILQEDFYKPFLAPHAPNRETFVPELPRFFEKRRANNVAIPENASSKLESIKTTLHIISQIFSHSSRFSQTGAQDRSDLLMTCFLVLTAAQDRHIIQDVFAAQSTKNIFHRLLDTFNGTDVAVVDIDVNAEDDDGDTAIMCAAKYCDEKVLKLLLDDTRVSLDTKNKDGRGLVVVIGIWGRGKNCSKEEKGKCLDMIKNERMKREKEREQTSQTKSIGQCIERIEKINERIEDEEKRHKENLHVRRLKRKDLNERQIFDTKILAEKHKEEKSLLDKKHKHEETMLEETLVREDDYEQRYIASLKERRDELAEDLEKLTTEPGNESSPERNKLEAAKGSLECPICMELMRSPTKIWMCPLTHVLCEDCKVYLKGGKCPTCTTERVSLRAFMAENLARTLFSD